MPSSSSTKLDSSSLSDVPPAYSPNPATLDYSVNAPHGYSYPQQTFNSSPQPSSLSYPVQPQVQTVTFPLFYSSGWILRYKVLETEETNLLPKDFLSNTKNELESIMDSALARTNRAMLYCIPITVVATMITVPITFLTSKSLSAGLPLAVYVFPFIFASMIAFIVLQVMLYRRLNAFCQSATMKSAEQYGEKIQLGLHSGRSWSWGDSTHYETFEFHDKNGRRICTRQYIRVSFQRQVMVPVFLVPIPNS